MLKKQIKKVVLNRMLGKVGITVSDLYHFPNCPKTPSKGSFLCYDYGVIERDRCKFLNLLILLLSQRFSLIMSKTKIDYARFIFFIFDQATIDLFASKAPTISAFQSFETFLLLSALGRHPQALVTLCSAIESASAASTGRKITDSSEGGLARGWEVLNEVIPRDFHLPTNPTRKQLREKRNDVTHFGFSNKDDHDCAFYSLGLGVPLFAGWAMGQYGINLYESCGNFGRLLKTTVEVIHDPKKNRITALDASSILRRWITFHLRESFLS